MNALTPSPFVENASAPAVTVAGGRGPYENTREALRGVDLSPARGRRVLLKPNAGRLAACGEGITTDPRVVAAAIDAFREVGADPEVGESPITGVRAREAFDATGIGAAARERGCRLVDMNVRPFVEVPIPDGAAIRSIKVCADVFDYDLVVSLPVMKVHMHTGVTLSVKNMKGCLWRRSKVDLHMLPPVAGRGEKPLSIAIADMSKVLCPHLAIIDGTVGMEGMGPSAGSARTLDAVVVGADAFAADAVACRLMEIDPREIDHLRIGAERGGGVIDLDRIQVRPDGWQRWSAPFAAAPENMSIAFPGVEILDRNSCSACQSTLLLFLKQYGEAIVDYFPEDGSIRMAIGKGHASVPDGTICIGNCMARQGKDGTLVLGCPPVGSEILKVMTGKTTIDSEKVSKEIKE